MSFLKKSMGKTLKESSIVKNNSEGRRGAVRSMLPPRYVKSINAKDNTVTLCKADERFEKSVTAHDISAAVRNFPENTFEALVKIRSTAKAEKAIITIENGILKAEFENSILAPTPGQSAVIYKDDVVLGSAVICTH